VITVAIGGATKISRFLDHQQNKPTTCGHLLHSILGPSKSRPFFTFWIRQPIERLADGTWTENVHVNLAQIGIYYY
jgi:hypothetical protein